MWYILAAVFILVGTGALGLNRFRVTGLPKSGSGEGMVHGNDLRSLSLDEINRLLDRLESEEPPERMMGAMCYSPMMYPEVAEYICPICGEKTLYEGRLTPLIEWELPGMRRTAENIDGITDFLVELDESSFCGSCSGEDTDDPAVLLRVFTTDGTGTVNRISMTDLRILESFLQGNLYYLTSNDGQEPLQGSADRIRELLGIPEDDQ